MATTKKISRKELKQPDEFISFWGRTIEFAQLHRREILIGISTAAVVALLVWAVSAHSRKRQEKASDLVTQAVQNGEREAGFSNRVAGKDR